MLSERLRPVIEPLTNGAGRALARARISPNGLTTFGLLAVIGCAALVANGSRTLGGILLIPAVIVDVLDGALARATGRVTAWGGFYDSVCDRLADGAIFGAIVWQAGDRGTVAAALVAMPLTFVVPYARAKAEAMGLRPASGPGERAERAVILIAGLIFGYVEVALWVLVALTAYTTVVRSLSVRRQAGRAA